MRYTQKKIEIKLTKQTEKNVESKIAKYTEVLKQYGVLFELSLQPVKINVYRNYCLEWVVSWIKNL